MASRAGLRYTKRMSRKRPVPLEGVLDRNIQALIRLRRQIEEQRSLHHRVVDVIVRGAGSIGIVYAHLGVILAWCLMRWAHVFEAWTSGITTSKIAEFAAVEAIFLSLLVLVNQKSTDALLRRREDLDLQISLITEHEITRILQVTDLIAKHLRIDASRTVEDLEESKKDLSPEMVLSRIEDVAGED